MVKLGRKTHDLFVIFQEQLDSIVQHYLRRIEWLSTGCRQVFGTLVEQRYKTNLVLRKERIFLSNDERTFSFLF